MTNFVLVHGSGYGPWCWFGVKEVLQAQRDRLPVEQIVLPELPGHGRDSNGDLDKLTLETYSTAVATQIQERDLRDVVLVAHSTAGAVVPMLVHAMPERLKRLVFVGGVIPADGASVIDALGYDGADLFNIPSRKMTEAWVREHYCNDMEEKQIGFLLKSLTAVPVGPLRSRVASGGFQKAVPVTYAVLEKDLAVLPGLQRDMLLALDEVDVATINAGHCAMMTRPRHVASVLLRYA